MKLFTYLLAAFTFIVLAAYPQQQARASCSASMPTIFVNGVSTVDAATTNGNNTFLLGCVNNVDHTQVGTAGIFVSQLLPNSLATATFGGSFSFTIALATGAQVPLIIQGGSGQSVDLLDIFNNSKSTKYFAVTSGGTYYGTIACAPNVQTFTSSSGTYTTPTCNGITAPYLEVQMCGGGGGGSAGDSGTSGTNGFTTTFGGSLGANGGNGGGGVQAGVGGAANGGSVNNTGNAGQPGGGSLAGTLAGAGGTGGGGPFGGAGRGSYNSSGINAPGACSGGGGGGTNSSASTIAGGGGGAGGYMFAVITTPAASFAYTVGGGGTGGTGLGNGFNGGNGSNGLIIVVAKWQ